MGGRGDGCAAAIAALTLAVGPDAHGNINLDLRPGFQATLAGNNISVDLYAVSDSLSNQTMAATQVILTWNTTFVQLLGFDNTGAEFDAEGRLKNWWTKEDSAHFKAATDKLVKQYDAYEPLPGLHINGTQTLGENIADVAGLQAAYVAYHKSLGGKDAPVIDGLTGDQRFYLGWAQVWRRKYREANLLQRLLTDPHSPSEQRAAVVRNLDPWYSAFNVRAGQRLYLAPDQRVRIW